MSRRFPVRNAKEVARVLRQHGFQKIDQAGSHQKWRSSEGRQVIVLSMVPNRSRSER